MGERLATSAGHAGPDNPFHHKMAGNVFQLPGHVFAELLERTAAIAAGITRRQDFFLAFKVIGQRRAIMGALGGKVFVGVGCWRRLFRLRGGSNFGVFLKIKCQLIHGLGFAAETDLAICRACARSSARLRATRLADAPEAVSLNTPTTSYPPRSANAVSSVTCGNPPIFNGVRS